MSHHCLRRETMKAEKNTHSVTTFIKLACNHRSGDFCQAKTGVVLNPTSTRPKSKQTKKFAPSKATFPLFETHGSNVYNNENGPLWTMMFKACDIIEVTALNSKTELTKTAAVFKTVNLFYKPSLAPTATLSLPSLGQLQRLPPLKSYTFHITTLGLTTPFLEMAPPAFDHLRLERCK